MKTPYLALAAAALAGALLLTGCGQDQEFKVGATAGPHASIVTKAAEVAGKRGQKVKVVEFTDYISPDRSLADKSLDANVMQHEPFLKNFNKQNNTNLKKVADAVVQPMGFYSKNLTSVDAVPKGASFSVPNDPTNGGRALLLIEKAGLIKLKEGVTAFTATPADIIDNPRGIKVVELEAAQLPRSLEDVDVACIPMNYVLSAGLSPSKGFFFESRDSELALIIIAARTDNGDSEPVKKFIQAYQSEEVREYINKTFDGAVRPAW